MDELIVDFNNLDSNLSIDDAKKYLQNLISRDKAIETNLKQYIKLKDDLEIQMESFDNEIPEYLTLSLKKSNELNYRISSTCQLAENLSSKVKKLDNIRERIKDTLKKVDDIIDLKNCIEGVQISMEREDYEGAAFHINRYLSIDKSVLEDNSSEKLAIAEKKLLSMIESKYQQSLQDNDQKQVLRFSILYVPLEKPLEGIDKYCNYLKNQSKKLDAMITHYRNYIQSPKTIKPISAVSIITKIFEHFAAIIEDDLPIIKSEFGVLHCPHFILNITQQCDYYSSKIYDSFNDQFQTNKYVNDILIYKQQLEKLQQQDGGKVSEKIDPRNFAQFLDETSMISKATKFYEKYLIRKEHSIKADIYQYYSKLEKEKLEKLNSIKSTIITSSNQQQYQQYQQQLEIQENKENEKLQKLIQEKDKQMKQTIYSNVTKQKMNQLLGNYILLEEYFMVESVNKAIQMESLQSIDSENSNINNNSSSSISSSSSSSLSSITPSSISSTSTTTTTSSSQSQQSTDSTMIDFIFFVLQKSLQRSIDSHSIQTLNVICNRLCRILSQTRDNLKKIFREYIIRSSSKSVMDYQSSLQVLNNLETSSEYIIRLKKEFDMKSLKIYPIYKDEKPKDNHLESNETDSVEPSKSEENNNIIRNQLNLELKKKQENDRDQVNILSNEFSNCSKSFSKILQEEIESLFKSVQPRLKNVLNQFTLVNYEINQLEYDNNDINDPFVLQFTLEISHFFKPFQEHLSITNYDFLVHQTIQFILKKIEGITIQQKKFTLLGGLQFGKDLRAISTYFTKISQSTIRDKFSKLNQISSFLILESLSEVEDHWNENRNSPTWKLSSSEVQKILMIRVDFNHDQILKLKFN
ncbi:hypothetical protein RB653_007635 [Dictyostelium firmibasis]|uniref:Conserved oligomeric Golgi complex subunit 4 n=1 Tax=Dictyostelium firmibasis TaxID=79012 RepID=A0AAN7TUW7_9MYCE